jgi:aromatic-amino-acid transaminase
MIALIPTHQGRPTEDPIFALNRAANARKAKGESVVNATIGAALLDDGKLAVLETAAKAVRTTEDGVWAAYAPISGSPAFLNAVMDEMVGRVPAMRSCAIAAATPGGTGALRHAISNFLEPGNAMLTTNFYWGPYATLADEAGCTVDTFIMFTADGGFDVAALDAAVGAQLEKQGRVLLFLNDPCHNPTGYSMRKEEWRDVCAALIKHASKGPIALLVDTAYIAYGAGDPLAFLDELTPLLGHVALLFAWSGSKTYTMYGLRVGAIIACIPDEKERAMTEAAFSYSCRGTWSNCNAGGLSAVARLMTDPELRVQCDKDRDAVKDTLFDRVRVFNEHAKPKGLKYPRYEGGFFVTVFRDDAQAHALKMQDQGVFVVPQKGALRVALCSVAKVDIPRLVDALA